MSGSTQVAIISDFPSGVSRIEGNQGSGNDAVFVQGDGSTIVDLDGGSGDDFVGADDSFAGQMILNGDAGNDTFPTSSGDDIINGGSGDDTIQSGGGNDTLNGENGNDAIEAGAGNDTLDGGSGEDGLFGGDGDDQLTGGLGDDMLTGESGRDTYIFANAWGEDALEEVAGDNIVDFSAATNALTFTLGTDNRHEITSGASSVTNLDKNIGTFIGGMDADTFEVSHVLASGMSLQGKQDEDQYNIAFGDQVLGNVTIIDMLGDNKLGVSSPYTTAVTMSAATIGHQSRTIDYADGNIQEFDIYALQSDVSVTQAISVTEGFIVESDSINWVDTVQANYLDIRTTDTININYDLLALNVLESGADALARVAADLADATIVRDTAQAALTAAQEDLDPAAVATAQANL